MYGVTKDLDLSAFPSATLEQICLGQHQVSFHFDPMGLITVESAWELLGADGTIIDRSLDDDQLPSDRDAYRLHVLLGCRVVEAKAEPPKSISLTFEKGYTLRVIDDSEQYESFHIDPGGIHI